MVSQARVQGSDIPTPAAMKAGKTRGDPITPRWARDGVPTPSDCTPPVVGVVGYLEGRRLGHGCPSFGGVVPRARPSVVRTWRAAERSLTVTPGMVGLNDGFAHRATLAGHTVRADPPGGGGVAGCRSRTADVPPHPLHVLTCANNFTLGHVLHRPARSRTRVLDEQGCVNRMTWNQEGTLLASVSDDLTLRLWGYNYGNNSGLTAVSCTNTRHRLNLFGEGHVARTPVPSATADVGVYTLSLLSRASRPAGAQVCGSCPAAATAT